MKRMISFPIQKHLSRYKDGLFDGAGNIGADSKKFLQNWMDQYAAWVKKHAA